MIYFIKDFNQPFALGQRLVSIFPESRTIDSNVRTDDELLSSGPAIFVLFHKTAVVHVKSLRFKADCSRARIIVVLPEENAGAAVPAMCAGANAVLVGNQDLDRVVRAINNENASLARIGEAASVIREGAIINGRYELRECLGAGLRAVMMLARDTTTGNDVTVKLLRKTVALTGNTARMFHDEARRLMHASSPTMAPVVDHGDWNGLPYMVLGIGKGENLYQVMGRRIFTEDDVIRLGLAMIHSLSVLKKNGSLHLDMRPENIILWNDNWHLTEFGLLQPSTNPLDNTGFPFWTDAAFDSPEFFLENVYMTARSDVYSLGLILRMAAFRENPYLGRPWNYEIKQRTTENLSMDPAGNNVLSPSIFVTVESMLLKREEARPRLRDLEIIFWQAASLSASPELREHLKIFADGGKADVHPVQAEVSETEAENFTPQPTRFRKSIRKMGVVELLLTAVFSLEKKHLKYLLIPAAALVFFFGGRIYQIYLHPPTHFNQGPKVAFTCYAGHTCYIRTLDFRTVRCPVCDRETSLSYTCRRCHKVFGLTIWPKRDMSEKECRDFQLKLMLCPYCKSNSIYRTPVP